MLHEEKHETYYGLGDSFRFSRGTRGRRYGGIGERG